MASQSSTWPNHQVLRTGGSRCGLAVIGASGRLPPAADLVRSARQSMESRLHSPDRHRLAVLFDAGEIRFGPAYYHLRIEAQSMDPRVFGSSPLWSSDSRYFAIQEWHSTRESDGPITSLVAFDRQRGVEVDFGVIHGFCVPVSFTGSTIRHAVDDWSGGSCIRTLIDTDLSKISEWK